MNNNNQIRLVADIGGTNIRIALANSENRLTFICTYQCANYAHIADVLNQYLSEHNLHGKVIEACLAIACPTDEDWIAMTNLPWAFSQRALKEELGFKELFLINDYKAIAMSIPYLNDAQKSHICGPLTGKKGQAISICGPGTGLGVATLFPVMCDETPFWYCINSEGGHIDFAPVDELDAIIFDYVQSRKHRVSYEQLLSGYGLEQIYQAIIHHNTQLKVTDLPSSMSASEISHMAITENCPLCIDALSQFCKVLGSFAGNLALLSNSQGGVYIAGGIIPRFIDFLKASEFQTRFEAKGRLSNIVENTPVYVVTESQPGLLGAAAFLNQLEH